MTWTIFVGVGLIILVLVGFLVRGTIYGPSLHMAAVAVFIAIALVPAAVQNRDIVCGVASVIIAVVGIGLAARLAVARRRRADDEHSKL